jgi:hypothetical protein
MLIAFVFFFLSQTLASSLPLHLMNTQCANCLLYTPRMNYREYVWVDKTKSYERLCDSCARASCKICYRHVSRRSLVLQPCCPAMACLSCNSITLWKQMQQSCVPDCDNCRSTSVCSTCENYHLCGTLDCPKCPVWKIAVRTALQSTALYDVLARIVLAYLDAD